MIVADTRLEPEFMKDCIYIFILFAMLALGLGGGLQDSIASLRRKNGVVSKYKLILDPVWLPIRLGTLFLLVFLCLSTFEMKWLWSMLPESWRGMVLLGLIFSTWGLCGIQGITSFAVSIFRKDLFVLLLGFLSIFSLLFFASEAATWLCAN